MTQYIAPRSAGHEAGRRAGGGCGRGIAVEGVFALLHIVLMLPPSAARRPQSDCEQHDRAVLEQFRSFRELAVQRDAARREGVYRALALAMARSCHLSLGDDDIKAAFAQQWRPGR